LRFFIALLISATFLTLGLIPALFDLTNLPVAARVAFLVIFWVLSVLSTYLTVYRPLRRRARQRLKPLARLVLDEFLRTYYHYTHNSDNVRVNIMLASRPKLRPWTRHLKIWHSVGEYHQDELDMVYPKGLGNCGRAFADNTTYWYDREKGHDQFLDVPQFANSVTKNLGSILSVPIYDPEDENRTDPIGVLNVDHAKAVEYSKFDDPEVREFAKRASSLIGVVLE
jgi:hypothetical protein